MLWYFRCNCRC